MDYQNFKSELYATILCKEETAGKCVKVTDKELCILWESDGQTCMLKLELDVLYEEFLSHGWRGVMAEIVERLRIHYFLGKYPAILRPLNFKRNEAELKEGIYWRFGDISLVLYAPLFERDEADIMMQVDRELIRQWHVEEHMLLEEALRVTSRVRPPRLYRSTDIGGFSGGEDGVFMADEPGHKIKFYYDKGERVQGYRLTALGYLNGAVAFFYPGVRERIAELLGGDYYVGFINVHEAVVHPVRYKVLQEMKAAILRASILGDRREVLTEKVYRYCCHQARLVEV